MEDSAAGNRRSAEAELTELRDRFTEEEERLYGERRYKELAGRLVNRAEQESGKPLAVDLVSAVLPLLVVVAMLVFDFGVLELVIGLGAVVLLHVAVGRTFDRAVATERAALRAWTRAVEEERGSIEEVDMAEMAEMAERLDPAERKMLEEGRIEELADRLQEAAGRKSGGGRRILYGAMGAVVAGGIAGAMIFGWPVLLLAAPLVASLGFLMHVVHVTDRALEEKASAGKRLREA